MHVAFNYVVRAGQRVRKDTKTHQDRSLAIDPDTCALIAKYLDEIRAELAAVDVELRDDACLFSNDPAHSRPWNPDWATHKVADPPLVLRTTAARLGHSSGGATMLRHYADPVPEVDRRAAAYLAQLTARSTPLSPQPLTWPYATGMVTRPALASEAERLGIRLGRDRAYPRAGLTRHPLSPEPLPGLRLMLMV